MSNTQHLGLVVRGEYLHLSRSAGAMLGTLGSLYKDMPPGRVVADVLWALNSFPGAGRAGRAARQAGRAARRRHSAGAACAVRRTDGQRTTARGLSAQAAVRQRRRSRSTQPASEASNSSTAIQPKPVSR